MLKGNLSSRPFYNERLVTAVIALVALVALALTAFNVQALMSLSSQRSDLVRRIEADQAQAARVRGEAALVQKSVDRGVLTTLAGETREANALIDRRTFSWTLFFGLLEKTLPIDVRLLSVVPSVDKGTIGVAMRVVARRVDALETFVNALQNTGAFYDVFVKESVANDDGTTTAIVESSYLPPAPPGRGAGAGGKGRP